MVFGLGARILHCAVEYGLATAMLVHMMYDMLVFGAGYLLKRLMLHASEKLMLHGARGACCKRPMPRSCTMLQKTHAA